MGRHEQSRRTQPPTQPQHGRSDAAASGRVVQLLLRHKLVGRTPHAEGLAVRGMSSACTPEARAGALGAGAGVGASRVAAVIA
jgi:hypothetical protein